MLLQERKEEGRCSKTLYMNLTEKASVLAPRKTEQSSIPSSTFFSLILNNSLSTSSNSQSLKNLMKVGFQQPLPCSILHTQVSFTQAQQHRE